MVHDVKHYLKIDYLEFNINLSLSQNTIFIPTSCPAITMEKTMPEGS